MILPDWLQDLFDLMCNERILLRVEGEMGEVYAHLGIVSVVGRITQVAEVVNESDFGTAMEELMKQYKAGGKANET